MLTYAGECPRADCTLTAHSACHSHSEMQASPSCPVQRRQGKSPALARGYNFPHTHTHLCRKTASRPTTSTSTLTCTFPSSSSLLMPTYQPTFSASSGVSFLPFSPFSRSHCCCCHPKDPSFSQWKVAKNF